MWWALGAAALLAAARAQPAVTVMRIQLAYEETHEVVVNASTEYILDFVPSLEQKQYPPRVWVRSEGGDPARPLLLAYRQPAGAGTWQLPWVSDARSHVELERTLCPAPDDPTGAGDCGEAEGWLSLQVSSACAQARVLRVRVAAARDWRLHHMVPVTTTITPEWPRVHQYRFEPAQAEVRLLLAADDLVCATIAVLPITTCPAAQSLAELPVTGAALRMTVTKSGATYLTSSRFPGGFYVVGIVHENDEACVAAAPPADDWLAAAALYGDTTAHARPAARVKTLTITTEPALSRKQYLVASVSTLAVFLAVYVGFGLAVLAQRWPWCYRLVGPRAKLAPVDPAQDSSAERRRRRDSNATFDSSDNSDTDSESDLESQRRATPASPASPASPARARSPASPGSLSPDGSLPGNPTRDVRAANGAARDGSAPRTPVVEVNASGVSTRDDSPPDSLVRAGSAPGSPTSDATAPNGSSTRDVTAPNGSPASAGAARDVTSGPTNGQLPADRDADAVATQTNEERAGAFGLPARLRVAALARRRGRVLRARADRYLTTLLTVAVFYALPVIQFVFTFQIFLNVSGSLDTCYYNFLCAHPAGALTDFNHVLSNLGYLLLGALFVLQLRRRRARRARRPRHEEYGIPAHYGLLAALGAGMMVVALLSASYHVCPNRLNFQFDTSFMYVLGVLSMVKIYQSRHPDVNARAHATFGVLAVLIALVVCGVVGGGPVFWAAWSVLHVFTFLLLSLRIYYLGQFRLEKESLQTAARSLRAEGLRPRYGARLAALLVANAANWAIALYGLFTQSTDFASHLLFVVLGNALLYMVFYLSMKAAHGERVRWYAWAFTAGAAAAWAPGLYAFTRGVTSWAEPPAASRARNVPCALLQFYDSHDLWHMLSALALYLSFNAMLTWDDGLSAVPRTEIAVF